MALVAAVATALLLTIPRAHDSEVDRRQLLVRTTADVTEAGQQFVTAYMSISAATVESDLSKIEEWATGEFADQFRAGRAAIRDATLTHQVAAACRVLAVAAVTVTSTEAELLVAADQTVTNLRDGTDRIQHHRIRLSLRHLHAGWRVARLEFVVSAA